MNKLSKKIRSISLVILLVGAFVFSILQLMKFQIVEGEDLNMQSIKKTSGTQEVIAPRGEIIDSQGNPLVKNEVGFNVIIDAAYFPADIQQQNTIILKTVNLLKASNVAWVDTMPISKEKPYKFIDSDPTLVSKLKTNLRLNSYATPDNCMDKLIELYAISPDYTQEEIRTIAGIRYEMLAINFSLSNNYTFAKGIPSSIVSKVKELSYSLPGIDINEVPNRVYADGAIFPHGLGTIGPIYAEEMGSLKEQGYKMNDFVGKSGIEKIMENQLRGTNGTRNVLIGPNKQVVSIEDTKPAVAGNTVQLTFDGKFQSKVQNILANIIEGQKKTTIGKNANAGAAVVLDVKTGAVKAMATYPSFNINDYSTNYTQIANDINKPLINRAIDGIYRPGSTFKTVTATASLNEGLIDENTKFTCQQIYKYSDVEMKCTGYHGSINVVTALQVSCNIFFYQDGERLGNARLVDYEKKFGLTVPLNFELGGKQGYAACPDTFQTFGMTWTPGQQLQASIGQSEVGVTPLQMAVQAMTIANKGVRYRPYIIDSVVSYDRSKIISKTQPVIESTIEDKTGKTFDIVKQGMILAAKNTDASPFYDNYADKKKDSLNGLPFETAIKTGTPQTYAENVTNNCVIGFYPAQNPEIAFCVYVENGDYSKYAVRRIIDAYYGYDQVVQNDQSSLAD